MKIPQDIVDKWLEAVWRAQLPLGDEIPDFSTLDPRGENVKSKIEPDQASKLPHDPMKCCARMYRGGFGIQCSRAFIEGNDLCKLHQKMFDSVDEGLDIRFGRFNGERPTHHCDKIDGGNIAWNDTRSSSKKKSSPPKLNKKEMLEYLSTRIPTESLKGLKKPALEELYHKEKALESDSIPDQSMSEVESESVQGTVQELVLAVEQSIQVESQSSEQEAESPDETLANQSIQEESHDSEENEVTPSVSGLANDSLTETVVSDDGAGTGLVRSKYTKSVLAHKNPFEELSINIEDLKGMKLGALSKIAFKVGATEEELEEAQDEDKPKAAIIKLIQLKQVDIEAQTDDLSDDELEIDSKEFINIDFEGVEYLEDEDSGEIYSTDHKMVGKWDKDSENILWLNDKRRANHEINKD